MSVSIVQTADATILGGPGVTALQATFANPVTAGNTIGVLVSPTSMGALTGTPTDSKGNTYHVAVTVTSPLTQNYVLGLYYAYDVAGGSSFTVTAQSQSYCCCGSEFTKNSGIIVCEISGLTTTDPLDKTATGIASVMGTAGSTSSTGTTSQPNEFLFAGTASGAATGAITAGSGYGNLLNLLQQGVNIAVEAESVSATGSYSASFGYGTTNYWAIALATFKAQATSTVSITYPTCAAVSRLATPDANACVTRPGGQVSATASRPDTDANASSLRGDGGVSAQAARLRPDANASSTRPDGGTSGSSGPGFP